VVRGHVLVCPIREIDRYADLNKTELDEMWNFARSFSKILKSYYDAKWIAFAIQDGINAGQSVKHVHLHILPKYSKDFDSKIDLVERLPRNEFDMYEEAELYRRMLQI